MILLLLLYGDYDDYTSWINEKSRRERLSLSEALCLPQNPGECEKTRKGNRALRMGLVQLAHSATHSKETYVATLFRRLAARRGKQRAMIAVAHSILVSVFSILVRHEPYRELGATYVDRRRHSQSVEHLTRRLEQLGYAVHLEPRPAA